MSPQLKQLKELVSLTWLYLLQTHRSQEWVAVSKAYPILVEKSSKPVEKAIVLNPVPISRSSETVRFSKPAEASVKSIPQKILPPVPKKPEPAEPSKKLEKFVDLRNMLHAYCPEIALLQEPAQMCETMIVCMPKNLQEQKFWKNLVQAMAISFHKKVEITSHLPDKEALLLVEEGLGPADDKAVVLKSAKAYLQDPWEKALLWQQLCAKFL